MTKPRGLKRLLKACLYTRDGLVDTYRTESAFRQELLLAAVLAPVAFYAAPDRVSLALMLGSLFAVLAVELVNSAIEAAIDRFGGEIHPLAKKAKDAGSAAVFVTLVGAGVMWLVLLV